MAQALETITSIQGVGEITAWALLAFLPELPELSRNRAVCLAGLAPFNDDSGAHCGTRKIEGGRFKLRKALYMPAQSAARFNPHIQAFYKRLIEKGKPTKVALVAVMRKLLLHIRSELQKIEKKPENALA